LIGSEDFSSIRLVKLSGEPVYKPDFDVYKKNFPPNCLLINMLASAEVGSVRACFLDKETPIHDNIVPVGYPLEGCEVLLLDNDGRRLGSNRIGEIAVRSRYLSPGYWRRPDLTEASFLSDPVGGDDRIYRTGDLGYMLPDGCLVHRGRKDSHVKIRGYSVEFAEIEAALIDLDGIKAAVVTTKQNSQGHQVLVAYVVLTGQPTLTTSSIRKAVAAKLPDYMVPSAFVVLDALPLTGPGKVNLQALPDPGRARPNLETPFASPRTPVEEEMVKIWREVLELDQVGIYDHFFELGGDSLQAGRVISRVIDIYRVDVPLGRLFETPTVAEMAALVEKHRESQITPEDLERMIAEVEKLSPQEVETRLSRTKG
jgi:acyl carrier protein